MIKRRVFDGVGGIVVAGWFILVVVYTGVINFGQEPGDAFDSEVVLEAGEAWMLLTRDDDEVGFMHETRTRVEDDSWLLEYEFVVNVAPLGIDQLIKTDVKARVDGNAVLQEVYGRIQTGPTSFRFRAKVEGQELVVSHDIGGRDQKRTIPLSSTPRLSNNAFNQLAALDEFEEGQVLEQEYFDPIFMDMKKLRFTFVRKHTLKIYDRDVETHHFKQTMGADELDVYIDRKGQVQIQELPMRMVAARIPDVVGRTRARALERRFEEEGATGGGDSEVSVSDAFSILRGRDQLTPYRWSLSDFPETLSVRLDSASQNAIEVKSDSALVSAGQGTQQVDVPDSYLDTLTTVDEAVVERLRDAGIVNALPDGATNAQIVESLARKIVERADRRVEPLPPFNVWALDEREPPEADDILNFEVERILSRDDGLSTLDAATLLFAAVRAEGLAARYVAGFRVVRGSGKTIVPHVWIQFVDRGSFRDIDPSRATLIPAVEQVQVTVFDSAIHSSDLVVLEQVDVSYERGTGDGSSAEDAPEIESDFD